MIRELAENIRTTWNMSLRAKYLWFRGLLNRKCSCGQKNQYSLRSAQKAKGAMEKKYEKKFDVYRCIWCGKYHIGGSIEKYMVENK